MRVRDALVGVRIGELRKVELLQEDLKTSEIRLEKRQTKGKKPRTIPIYGEMRPWLEMQKAKRDQKWPNCPWVFHYLSKPIGRQLKGFVDACEVGAFRRFVSMICVARRFGTWSAQDMKLATARRGTTSRR